MIPPMSGAIAGRDAELASLRAFVGEVSEGAVALVLQGEAGMGKTTLWNAGVRDAQERGLRVLQAVPAESETELSFAGLGDLLDGVLDEVLETLPEAQRRALSRALVLEDDEGPPPDPHAVGVATLNALRALAAAGAVVVAVDDVQWLDTASSSSLGYAVRRLRGEPVGLLLARRSGLESPVLDDIRRALPAERFVGVEVGPLGVAALHHVVFAHLAIALPRPLLAEVHQASGGNPFYALEIVRMLMRSDVSVEAGQPLPVPESLHELVHGRLLALPPESRDFLLAAAAHAHPTLSITEAASGVAREAGLRPALEGRIVELDGERIRFTHPLLAAGAYETADPLRRGEIHARLADLLDDPEARAWQLAAAAEQPDAHVAAALEEASRHARARGAPRPAALLLDRAGELTPTDRPDDAIRRTVEAAYLHFESGDSPRAEARLHDVLAEVSPGPERARALVRLARIRSYEAQGEAANLFLQAVDEADGHPEILAIAHEGVASCFFRLRERLSEGVEHAQLAGRLASELEDDALAAEALGSLLVLETLLGRGEVAETAERMLPLQDRARDQRVLSHPSVAAAIRWWFTDELPRSREALIEMLRRSHELGDESSLPYVLVILGQVECALCEFESSLERATEGRGAAEQSGQHTLVAYHRALESLVEAQRGHVEPARMAALSALERVPETGGRPAELVATRALGHLELALAAPESAVALLAEAVAFVRREQIAEPGAIPFVVDLVEALVELGRQDEAVELLDWYEGNARRLGRASALASSARCRGLLAAQAGELDSALRAYEEALGWHAKVELPLDRGRTLLVLGALQRRMKRRRQARETLENALAIFDRIGAELWAERAQAELARISGRAATPGALTPAEERVAALVAEGKTNREVAAALFLSERTVEGHLSHVFGKLGIRQRTEVARALDARQTQVVAGSNTGDTPVSAAPPAP
jgi:DNA-binding CsgD family transcriptional regulator